MLVGVGVSVGRGVTVKVGAFVALGSGLSTGLEGLADCEGWQADKNNPARLRDTRRRLEKRFMENP